MGPVLLAAEAGTRHVVVETVLLLLRFPHPTLLPRVLHAHFVKRGTSPMAAQLKIGGHSSLAARPRLHQQTRLQHKTTTLRCSSVAELPSPATSPALLDPQNLHVPQLTAETWDDFMVAHIDKLVVVDFYTVGGLAAGSDHSKLGKGQLLYLALRCSWAPCVVAGLVRPLPAHARRGGQDARHFQDSQVCEVQLRSGEWGGVCQEDACAHAADLQVCSPQPAPSPARPQLYGSAVVSLSTCAACTAEVPVLPPAPRLEFLLHGGAHTLRWPCTSIQGFCPGLPVMIWPRHRFYSGVKVQGECLLSLLCY